MKTGPCFTVPVEQSSSWGCVPQRFLPSCREGLPSSKAFRPSLRAGALRAACSLPRNCSPGEGLAPASTSPLPLCLAVTWMLFPASWFGATQTASTERLWGSRKEKGSWTRYFLAAIGKMGKIRKRKCKWHCIHRLPTDFPFQEKKECASMLQLLEFPVKHAGAMDENWSTSS